MLFAISKMIVLLNLDNAKTQSILSKKKKTQSIIGGLEHNLYGSKYFRILELLPTFFLAEWNYYQLNSFSTS